MIYFRQELEVSLHFFLANIGKKTNKENFGLVRREKFRKIWVDRSSQSKSFSSSRIEIEVLKKTLLYHAWLCDVSLILYWRAMHFSRGVGNFGFGIVSTVCRFSVDRNQNGQNLSQLYLNDHFLFDNSTGVSRFATFSTWKQLYWLSAWS